MTVKKKAHDKVRQQSNFLLRKGVIRRPTNCSKCQQPAQFIIKMFPSGKTKKQSLLEMHHTDPTDPRSIVWLCQRCHVETHGNNYKWTPNFPRINIS